MKKILGLALAGALSVAALPAVAADYPLKAPPPPIWTWTGFYVGVQAGVGWLTARQWDAGGFNTGFYQGTGAEVGGTLGWNWQAPGSPWVLGIEGDWSWTSMRATVVDGCFGPTCKDRLNWLATVRGRIGHANGPLLAYLTGGVAFASVFGQEGLCNASAVSGPAGGCGTTTRTGWTIGGGLEGALGGGWSLKGEYLYVNLGTRVAFNDNVLGVFPIAENLQLSAHIVRAGVNYKF